MISTKYFDCATKSFLSLFLKFAEMKIEIPSIYICCMLFLSKIVCSNLFISVIKNGMFPFGPSKTYVNSYGEGEGKGETVSNFEFFDKLPTWT